MFGGGGHRGSGAYRCFESRGHRPAAVPTDILSAAGQFRSNHCPKIFKFKKQRNSQFLQFYCCKNNNNHIVFRLFVVLTLETSKTSPNTAYSQPIFQKLQQLVLPYLIFRCFFCLKIFRHFYLSDISFFILAHNYSPFLSAYSHTFSLILESP